ncbi:MAG: exodeoxyribonuclease V subunit beta [Acidobacteria bacterium]|nr:exodeoxyribonuclease V subunit beta [Acidobacteriota bacterium]
MADLNPFDLELKGDHLIEASAGTGKTFTLVALYLRLLLEEEWEPAQILVVTFTEPATEELKERVHSTLRCSLAFLAGEIPEKPLQKPLQDWLSARRKAGHADAKRLQQILDQFDDWRISTIHSFCSRVLREFAFETGAPFTWEIQEDAGKLLLNELVEHFQENHLFEAHPDLLEALSSMAWNGSLAEILPKIAAWLAEGPLHLFPADPGPYQPNASLAPFLDKLKRVPIPSDNQLLKQFNYSKNQKALQQLKLALSAEQPSNWLWLDLKFLTSAARLEKGQTQLLGEFPDFFETMDGLAEQIKTIRNGLQGHIVHLVHRFAREISQRWSAEKQRLGFFSYQDTLRETFCALQRFPDLAGLLAQRCPIALVDEFQDTDPLQYQIFRSIYGQSQARGLFLIGDPKQAIYRFRGGDIFTYLQAKNDLKLKPQLLTTNFRSDPNLLTALNALYQAHPQPFGLEAIPYHAVSPAPHAPNRLFNADQPAKAMRFLYAEGANSAERDAMADQMLGLQIIDYLQGPWRIEGKPIRARDIAILVEVNREALKIAQALRAWGIQSVFSASSSVFSSEEAAELGTVLKALVYPNRMSSLRSALVTSICGFDLNALHELFEDDHRSQVYIGHFRRAAQLWRQASFGQMWRFFNQHFQVEKRWAERTGHDRKITNLHHLLNLLSEASYRDRMRPIRLLRWFEQCIETEVESESLQLESQADAVRIMTVHKAKGLQFPIVFYYLPIKSPGKAKFERFHNPDQPDQQTVNLLKEDWSSQIATDELHWEKQRLLYVALTRAQHQVVVLMPGMVEGKHLDQHNRPNHLMALLQVDAMPPHRLEALRHRISQIPHTQFEWVQGQPQPIPLTRPDLKLREAEVLPHRIDSQFVLASYSRLIFHAEQERDRFDPTQNKALNPEHEGYEALEAFPGGARFGEMVHLLLEECDFAAGPPLEQVQARLKAFRFDPELAPQLHGHLQKVLATPIGGFALRDLNRQHTIPEMEFFLPLKENAHFSNARLVQAFQNQPNPKLSPGYLESLGILGFPAMRGFFKGFIDLVFQHDGRWYLVDYKTNFLGASMGHYQAENMASAMAQHHYYLQYHLYSVALIRFLKRCKVDWRFEKFGGVFYLFLRGMSPDHPGHGVFFDRPPETTLTALDRLFAGGDDVL